MRLPWDRKSENLSELPGFSPKPSPPEAFDSLVAVFWKIVASNTRKLKLAQEKEDELNREVFVELTSLLLEKYPGWSNLKRSDVEHLIPELVKATHWKLRIKAYAYPETTAQLARDGMAVLPVLKKMLNNFLNDKADTTRKSLVKNYIHTTQDAESVTERALRCLIAYLRHTAINRQTIFYWDENYQLGIKSRNLETYLNEQLSLYTYFFKGETKAAFLDEIRIVLRKYVNSRISGRARDLVEKDIVQDIFMAFFNEKKVHGNSPDQFFVDKRLTSYFIGLERDKKIIDKYREEYQAKPDIQFAEDTWTEEEEQGFSDELLIILRTCLRKLSESCREVIDKKIFGDYSDSISLVDLASLLDIPYRTLEKQASICYRQLRDCVILNSKLRGFRLKTIWTNR